MGRAIRSKARRLIQDEVARTIAALLAVYVNKAGAERTLLKPPATWQA
jgi:adenylate cyclase